jgi:hypothetical protein
VTPGAARKVTITKVTKGDAKVTTGDAKATKGNAKATKEGMEVTGPTVAFRECQDFCV